MIEITWIISIAVIWCSIFVEGWMGRTADSWMWLIGFLLETRKILKAYHWTEEWKHWSDSLIQISHKTINLIIYITETRLSNSKKVHFTRLNSFLMLFFLFSIIYSWFANQVLVVFWITMALSVCCIATKESFGFNVFIVWMEIFLKIRWKYVGEEWKIDCFWLKIKESFLSVSWEPLFLFFSSILIFGDTLTDYVLRIFWISVTSLAFGITAWKRLTGEMRLILLRGAWCLAALISFLIEKPSHDVLTL